MTPEEVKGSGYQKPEVNEGISAAGRAFLEALARRKRAKGEELPPLYLRLLEGLPGEEDPQAPPPPPPAPPAPMEAGG